MFAWPPSTAALVAAIQAGEEAILGAIQANTSAILAAIEANTKKVEANTKLLDQVLAVLNRPTTLGLNLEAGTFKHQPVPTKKGP
jgi:hypothetical protein